MNIEELKEFQKKIIKKNRTCNIIGIFLFIVIASIGAYIILSKNIEPQFIIFSTFIGAIVPIIIITIIKSATVNKDIIKFNREFKKIFVLNSINKVFGNITYNPDRGFTEEFIEKNNILYTGDAFDSNDYIEATYKNIKFVQSDIHISEKREEKDSDGNTDVKWVTIFRGRLMIFDFNKPFKANLQVVSPNLCYMTLTRRTKYNKVTMEDPEFNKRFNVFAENEHEAFYILTPHFMERIKEITNKLDYPIMFYFSNSKLHIAIDDNSDSFEWDPLKPIDEKAILENITSDIKIITSFVDELNLYNDLFKKEA